MPLHISGVYFEVGLVAYLTFGIVALGLFGISYYFWWSKRRHKEVHEERHEPVSASEEPKKLNSVGYGKVVDPDHIVCDGQKLKYFIIKDKKTQIEQLAVNTVVIVLKRNAKEAHVRAATKDEIVKLRKQGADL